MAKADKKTYRVKGRVNHDGVLHTDGDDIELTDAQAQPLLDGGDIVNIERPKAAAPASTTPPPPPPPKPPAPATAPAAAAAKAK